MRPFVRDISTLERMKGQEDIVKGIISNVGIIFIRDAPYHAELTACQDFDFVGIRISNAIEGTKIIFRDKSVGLGPILREEVDVIGKTDAF